MKTIEQLLLEAEQAERAFQTRGLPETTLDAAIQWHRKNLSDQWQPKNIIAFLKAFAAMREALLLANNEMVGHRDFQMDSPISPAMRSVSGAIDQADAVLEQF